MKLWIGAETQADIVDEFRPIRNEIERRINTEIESVKDDIGVDGWKCIVVLRDDDNFEEIVKLFPKRRSMDFRLRIDYQSFRRAPNSERKRLLIQLLLRSLALLKDRGCNSEGIDKLVLCLNRIDTGT